MSRMIQLKIQENEKIVHPKTKYGLIGCAQQCAPAHKRGEFAHLRLAQCAKRY